ncbi:mitochondrial 54S ribosomal protein uL13m MRPL23 [Sporobolomyces koalae]|uniref:mitochondrial 54S ribosomal protein uL13m MRPL23 n=1 Tax=Sporobolomyces koalae TaxID=500713 RepID=UPI00317197B7
MPRLATNPTVGNTALAFTRTWRGVDATDQVLGRIATRIAIVLMGKHKPIYDPANDCGDYVVVRNATKIKVTGKKEDQLVYRHHTMFAGGLKEIPYKTMMERKPEQIIRRAVSGMLPKNRLRQKRLDRLVIFPEGDVGALEANLLKDYEGEFGKTWKEARQARGTTPAATTTPTSA